MLTALLDGTRVAASARRRSDRYVCPDAACGARVILKTGTRRIPHFAHKPGSACALAWESEDHMQAKLDIAGEYLRRGLRAEVEVPVPSPIEDRRADVLIASPRNERLRYAIEIQDSAIGEEELWRRTKSYAAAHVRPIWISLLRPESWKPEPDEKGRPVVPKFAPRLHERWIEQTGGALWMYDAANKSFWRAAFENHMLTRGGVNFIDVELGEHIEIDAYQVASERWVTAVASGPWGLNQIRIDANGRRPIGTLIGVDSDDSGRTEEGGGGSSP